MADASIFDIGVDPHVRPDKYVRIVHAAMRAPIAARSAILLRFSTDPAWIPASDRSGSHLAPS
jgi:hypothetical protein